MTGLAGTAGESVIRPGLDRIRASLAAAGNPERSFRAVHIAGTNGKGSTAAFAEAILRRLLPAPVGLYTSPHLVAPEERIRVNGRKIPAARLGRLFREAASPAGAGPSDPAAGLTWFEAMTRAAFDWFRMRGVGVAVVETGLGGRWDATNACVPLVTVITRIAVDHREWLGNTIREIALEKAGIMKTGVPCVVGRLGAAARRTVRAAAAAARVPLWEFGREYGWVEAARGAVAFRLPGVRLQPVHLAAGGAFQRDNAAAACAAVWRACEALGVEAVRFAAAAKDALETTRPPGRFEAVARRGWPTVWLDGAHNPDAARALARELCAAGAGGANGAVAVWSMLREKDIGGFVRAMSGAVALWVIYPLAHERAAPVDALAGACRAAGARFSVAADFGAAAGAARRAAGPGGSLVVCGSFVAVGDACRAGLGTPP